MKQTREVLTMVRLEGKVTYYATPEAYLAEVVVVVGTQRYPHSATAWHTQAHAEAALTEQMDRIEKELTGAPAPKETEGQ